MFRIKMNSQSQTSITVLRFDNELISGKVVTHILKFICFYLTTSINR